MAKTKDELLDEAKDLGVDAPTTKSKAELEKAVSKAAKSEHPDTPSGQGLQAAEGLEGEAAAEAYQAAKKAARWG
jgi:hypothetical protein